MHRYMSGAQALKEGIITEEHWQQALRFPWTLEYSYAALLARKPVRDATETLAEVSAAISAAEGR